MADTKVNVEISNNVKRLLDILDRPIKSDLSTSDTPEGVKNGGWATLDKTVDDVIEVKVRDAKEDLDTLLVFAGLFATVLTAFLVESYKTLIPDSSTTTVYLVQQSVSQNFTIASGPTGSSASVQPSAQSNIPRWAVLVNILWFASLLCSVAAASLAMLVQQWLREYLAVEYISPQSRVRARIYRRNALKQWRVLEIAGLLAPLLQIALGLFLVGMCYFTASVQKSLLCTSLPLVGGWAFCIFMTTIAPLFSARCPFKTPLLKSAMKLSRRYISPRFRRALRYIFASILLSPASAKLASESPAVEEEDVAKEEGDDLVSLTSLDKATQDDELVPALCEAFKQSGFYPSETVPFVTAMIQNRLGPESVPEKDLQAIPDLRGLSSKAFLTLTDFVAETLSRQLAGPFVFATTYPSSICDMVFLLLSTSKHPLTSAGLRVLETCLGLQYWRKLADTIANSQQESFVPMAKSLVSIYMAPNSPTMPIRAMQLYAKCLCQHPKHVHEGRAGLLSLLHDHEHTSSKDPRYIKYFTSVMDDMWPVLLASLRSQVVFRKENNLVFKDGSMEAFTIVWELFEGSRWEDEILEITRRMWIVTKQTRFLFFRAVSMHRAYRVDSLCDILMKAYMQSDTYDRDAMMTNFFDEVLDALHRGWLEKGEEWPQIDFIRLCRLYLIFAEKLFNEQLPKEFNLPGARSQVDGHPGPDACGDRVVTLISQWDDLWTKFAKCITTYQAQKRWNCAFYTREWHPKGYVVAMPEQILAEDRDIAQECLQKMKSLERFSWRTDTTPLRASLFPTTLEDALLALIAYRSEPQNSSLSAIDQA